MMEAILNIRPIKLILDVLSESEGVPDILIAFGVAITGVVLVVTLIIRSNKKYEKKNPYCISCWVERKWKNRHT